LAIVALGLTALILSAPCSRATPCGVYLEIPPWYDAALADTSLSMGLGVTYVDAPDPANLYVVDLTPIRRGPVELAWHWSYIFMRDESGHRFGAGDPKLFGRVRIPFQRRWPFDIYIDAAARLSTASASLFPYALGGQDIELGGSLVLRPIVLAMGAGRVMTHPPSGTDLTTADVPDANHFWILFTQPIRPLLLSLRVDTLLLEIKDDWRGSGRASVVHRSDRGFSVSLEWMSEFGPNRILDNAVTLRFAMRIR
jgi:hypothetical protein